MPSLKMTAHLMGGGAWWGCVLCVLRLGSFRWILSELEVQSNFNWILIYFTRNLQVPVLVNACTSRKSKGGAGSVSKVRL